MSLLKLFFFVFLCVCVHFIYLDGNRISGVIVSELASSAVDRGFEPRSGQTKDNKIGICCFFDKHAALARGDMSISGLLFRLASTIKI